MNQLFKYEENEVRTVVIEGEPWFVAKDIAAILEFSETSAMTRYLDADEKTNLSIKQSGSNLTTNITVINESGVYSAIFKSRKPEARTFKRWVTSEVLPAIRKHGGYLTPDKIEEALLNPDVLINLATQLKQERTERLRLQAETEEKSAIIAEQAPKVEYHDRIISSNGALTVSQIAKDYGLSAEILNRILQAEDVQYRSGKQWVLKSKYQKLGYTKSETGIIGDNQSYMNTKWTQAGRLFIHRLLESKGITAEYGPSEQGLVYLESIKRGRQKTAHSIDVTRITVRSNRNTVYN